MAITCRDGIIKPAWRCKMKPLSAALRNTDMEALACSGSLHIRRWRLHFDQQEHVNRNLSYQAAPCIVRAQNSYIPYTEAVLSAISTQPILSRHLKPRSSLNHAWAFLVRMWQDKLSPRMLWSNLFQYTNNQQGLYFEHWESAAWIIGSASHYLSKTSLFIENGNDAIALIFSTAVRFLMLLDLALPIFMSMRLPIPVNLFAMRALLALPHSLTHLVYFNGSKKQYGVPITTDTPYISTK